jgi:hypothetical protein
VQAFLFGEVVGVVPLVVAVGDGAGGGAGAVARRVGLGVEDEWASE